MTVLLIVCEHKHAAIAWVHGTDLPQAVYCVHDINLLT